MKSTTPSSESASVKSEEVRQCELRKKEKKQRAKLNAKMNIRQQRTGILADRRKCRKDLEAANRNIKELEDTIGKAHLSLVTFKTRLTASFV